jgi:metal-responsive CopG/Arc/MetJ family transcriptional regulator
MWSVTRENLDKNRKINVNFTIDKHLYEQFKQVAQKDMRKYSNIVEVSIRRYVQSKL